MCYIHVSSHTLPTIISKHPKPSVLQFIISMTSVCVCVSVCVMYIMCISCVHYIILHCNNTVDLYLAMFRRAYLPMRVMLL